MPELTLITLNPCLTRKNNVCTEIPYECNFNRGWKGNGRLLQRFTPGDSRNYQACTAQACSQFIRHMDMRCWPHIHIFSLHLESINNLAVLRVLSIPSWQTVQYMLNGVIVISLLFNRAPQAVPSSLLGPPDESCFWTVL